MQGPESILLLPLPLPLLLQQASPLVLQQPLALAWELLLALPLASLDRLAIQRAVDDIGRG